MRTLAVGDVHGCSAALDALLSAVRPAPDDRLVFLGDYVDRGPDSRGVLDRLIALRAARPNAVFLRGNHELMMVRARGDRGALRDWLSVGGDAAMASYSPDGRPASWDAIPAAHWAFLTDHLRDGFETDTHIFVHANLFPDLPLDEQPELMLFWEFLTGPIRHESGKAVVCGHTSQRGGVPVDYGDTVCIDTRAHAGGWLTCLDVAARRYWQANQHGETRTDWLEPPDDE